MRYILFLLSFLLTGCYDSGYHPSYIISHTPPEEESVAESAPPEQQR